MILTHWKATLATALCVVVCFEPGSAQVTATMTLRIEVANAVRYVDDAADVTTIATNPTVTTAIPIKNFRRAVLIGDIVAVNGQPAKGTLVENTRDMILRTTPTPGQGIADVTRDAMLEWVYEILNVDGSPVGSIMVLGVGGGTPPPGAPLLATQGNNAIVGGTGAFLGARGLLGQAVTSQTSAIRQASMTEDPSARIENRGGRIFFVVQLIPMATPQIVATSGGPAVFHSDFSPVTAAKPARAAEVLITMATGLGPTLPGVDPGQPFPSFPASPLQLVNSPVDVTVNGQSVGTINAVGWPKLVDTYRVDFQVPAGTPAGTAAIQLSAAWILGPSVNIPIQ